MFTLGLVQEKDIEKLAEVFARSFTEFDKEKPWDKEHAYEYLKYWFKKQPDLFFGAYHENGVPIGAMVVNIKPWRTGIRCSDGVIFVDPLCQKGGVAKSLFKKVVQESMEKYNATTFEAITFAGKEFPLSWYRRIGLAEDDHAVFIKGKCADILSKL